jgi:peroxiredoxin Q/BCP
MSEIHEGVLAPDFTLPSSEGKDVTLSSLKGKYVVLYFYPKDDTPGCTKEACNFRDRVADYESVGAKIYGVSVDDMNSHQKFIKKYQLPFPLLADTEKKVVGLYGVWKEKSFMGKKYMGTERNTFVIDPEGKIIKIFEKVKVDDHHQEVLAFIQEDMRK